MKVCSKCEIPNSNYRSDCSACGAELSRRIVEDRSGWYPDAGNPRQERFWDGKAWTGRVRIDGKESKDRISAEERATLQKKISSQLNAEDNSQIDFEELGRDCPKCETGLPFDAAFCIKCGSKIPAMTAEELTKIVAELQKEQKRVKEESSAALAEARASARNYSHGHTAVQRADLEPSLGYAILGFFFPAIGLILYLVWKDTKPGPATSSANGALLSAILGGVLFVIYICIIVSILNSANNAVIMY